MISWDKRNRRWKARLAYHGTKIFLGNFEDRVGAEMANEAFWDEERRQGNKLLWWLAWRFDGRPDEYLGAAVLAIRAYAREACGQSLFKYVTEWVKRGGAEVDYKWARDVMRVMVTRRGGYLYAYCFMGEKWEDARRRYGRPVYSTFQHDIEVLTKDAEAHIIERKEVC